ncbi:MAG: hypothetical protein LBR98_01370 [Syntrophomonadaceae bacterium]|nr:hypothetical protein [Syntrophomonadaceae bacterium]
MDFMQKLWGRRSERISPFSKRHNKYKETRENLSPKVLALLQNNNCGGCRHNCRLSAPGCKKGRAKAGKLITDFEGMRTI